LIGGDVIGLDDGADDVVRHLPEFLRFGAAEAGGVDRREGQAGVVDEDVNPTEPLPRRRDDAVAIRRPTQIRDQRQDLPRDVAAGRFRLDVGDIRVDVADRDDVVTLAPNVIARPRPRNPPVTIATRCSIDPSFSNSPQRHRERRDYKMNRRIPSFSKTLLKFISRPTLCPLRRRQVRICASWIGISCSIALISMISSR
jgi:hypothetical protein